MRKISSRATDSSDEVFVMKTERCGGIVWEGLRNNLETRMKL